MRKLSIFFGIILLAFLSLTAFRGLKSSVYEWEKLSVKKIPTGDYRSFFSHSTRSLNELNIMAMTLKPGKEGNEFQIDGGFEELIKKGLPSHSAHTHPDEEIILVRKGFVEESIKGKAYLMGSGSIIFLTNDDMHGIRNAGKGECEYYAIRWLTE